MKTYLRVVGVVLVLFIGWRLIAPSLVSAPSDMAVVLGVVVAIATPILSVLLWRFTKSKETQSNA